MFSDEKSWYGSKWLSVDIESVRQEGNRLYMSVIPKQEEYKDPHFHICNLCNKLRPCTNNCKVLFSYLNCDLCIAKGTLPNRLTKDQIELLNAEFISDFQQAEDKFNRK